MLSVYSTRKMNFSLKIQEALDVEIPCKIVAELNEDGEIVIRSNGGD